LCCFIIFLIEMNRKYYRLFATIFLILIESKAFCQATVQPTILTKTQWSAYFTKHFNVTPGEPVKTEVSPSTIPFPSVWQYAPTNKYRLYSFGNTDYMALPSNNGIGTYLFFFDYTQPEKDFIEMNFVADSIVCQQLPKGILMFKLTNDEFKMPGDGNNFNRYIFSTKDGHIASKAVVAHGCSILYNSIDTLHSIIYFNIQYPNRVTCPKCMRFDYKNNMVLSDIGNIEGRTGTIQVDDVHWCPLKKVETAVN